MKRIYVSYRRADTSESYGRIVERLRNYFGSEATLRSDSAYTATGETVPASEYRAYVADAMKRCAVLLLLVGPHWVQSTEPGGWSLSDLDDPVRLEIEAALRAGVPIVPALVQHGRIPNADELPVSLRLLLEQGQAGRRGRQSLLSLVGRSGLQVRRDPDFGGDAQRLCEVIENLAGLEATSLERAGGTITRALRTVTLVASAALVVHAGILAYFALNVVLPLPPEFALPTHWLPTIILTSLVDWGVYFLAGYAAARRTGDVGLGISAAVTAYVVGLVVGIALFADITWSRWQALSGTIPTPPLLVGGPGWLVGSVLLLMRPVLLLCTILVLGTPLGLAASFALGSLGGILGVRITELLSARRRAREREALIQREGAAGEKGAARRFGATLVRNRAAPVPILRRGATPAGKVFISYRRDDSAVMCGAIYDRLTDIFGVDTIFKDVDMIPVGTNFEKFISSTLEQCVAQVVIIGPRWSFISTPEGQRRLEDPRDFVRLEVESALQSNLNIIPVLVQGATMPSAEELPESLRPLADISPIPVRYAPDFDGDLRDLGLELAPVVWPESTRRSLWKRITTLEAGPRVTQTASLFWNGLFLIYGVLLGIEIVRGLDLRTGTAVPSLVTVLGAAPVIMATLAAASGAHLGYITGQAGRAFWLAWRAVLLGGVAVVLTTQIYGASRFASPLLALQETSYREFTFGVLAAAVVVVLGPALFLALLGASISSLLRRRRSASGRSSLLVRDPRTLQVIYQSEDTEAGVRITYGLAALFGRRVLPSKRQSLQAGVGSDSGPASTSSHLERVLRRSSALFVLVGPSWRTSDPESGLDDPENALRVRIEAALALGRPVVPVLLTNATMPSPDQLPVSLHEFAMLNAAWVRDDPDYPGDMRRLARVIERLTPLREEEPAGVTRIPLFLGIIFSALALIGADAVATHLVIGAYRHLTQASLILAGSELVIADLLIYGITASLVTRWSGRRQNGVLAALLGASVAMLAAVKAFLLAGTSWHAGLVILTGSPTLASLALSTIAVYLVIRPPVQSFGALAAASLGSFYGLIAYRGRKRRQEERRLYTMARAAIQSEPLAEMAARSARAGTPTQPGVEETLPETGEVTVAATAGVDADPTPPLPDSSGEEARRTTLLTEMRVAQRRARTKTRLRLGVALGLVAAVLVIAILGTDVVYHSQVHTIAAAAEQSAAATATYVTSPGFVYSTVELGPTCESGPGRPVWTVSTRSTSFTPSCEGTDTKLANHNLLPAMMTLTLRFPYARTYHLELDIVDFPLVGPCAGLVASGQDGSPGSAIEYVVCQDETWYITSVKGDGTKIKTLAHGSTAPQSSYQLDVSVYANDEQFAIDGTVVKVLFNTGPSGGTDFTGVCLTAGSTASGALEADVSNFSYQPLPATPT